MMNRVLPRRKTGFTLIELLVVIAIIALLAAILFPVFSRARESARKSSCASNMKQIGLGILQYAQDYDESFPGNTNGPGNNPTAGVSPTMTWRRNIYAYVKSAQVFVCPSNPNSKVIHDDKDDTLGLPDIRVSYASNFISNTEAANSPNTRSFTPFSRGTGGTNSEYAYRGVRLSEISAAAQCILVVENMKNSASFDVTAADLTPAGTASCPTATRDWSCMMGHLATSNFLFVDGHVKALKPISTINATAGATQPGNMWYRDGTGMAAGSGYNNARATLSTPFGM